jgi:protein translocase SecG subunit
MVIYNVLIWIAIVVSFAFMLLVIVTGKGDAMGGGGGSVRTTFKGKSGFDDQISRITLMLGGGFLALMFIIEIVSNRLANQ